MQSYRMIKYITGDLLEANQKVIVHGCNSMGIMGSGVARVIREKWPEVFEAYHLHFKTFGLKLGEILPVTTHDGKVIVNAITQQNFGRSGQQYCSYAAIETCFSQINVKAIDWDVREIALPKIGAGLGGGSWTIIENIILKTAKTYTPVVYSL